MDCDSNQVSNGEDDDVPPPPKRQRVELVDGDERASTNTPLEDGANTDSRQPRIQFEDLTYNVQHGQDDPSTSGPDETAGRKRNADMIEVCAPPLKRHAMENEVLFGCDVCKLTVTRQNWSRHLKTKRHIQNQQDRQRESSEMNVNSSEWDRTTGDHERKIKPPHEHGQDEPSTSGSNETAGRKRSADMNQVWTPPPKRHAMENEVLLECNVCKLNVTRQNWSRHLKTRRHTQNQQDRQRESNEMDFNSLEGDRTTGDNKHKINPPPVVRTQPINQVVFPTRPSLYSHTTVPSPSPRVHRSVVRNQPVRRVTRSVTVGHERPTSLKTPCPICGTRVLLQSMKRHQQSKKCKHSFEVVETRTRQIKKYQATETNYRIKVNVVVQVEPAINRMIEMAKERNGYLEGDRIIVVASHPEFRHNISVVLDSRRNNAKGFMDQVENIISSNETIDITGIRWNVKVIKIPRGQRSTKRLLNLARDTRTKQCIVQIKNKDNLCGPRAIITALSYHTNKIFEHIISDREKKLIRQGWGLQKKLANELCSRLVDWTEEGFTLEDFKNVEELLEVQIKIICAENMNTIIYEGTPNDTILYLYKSGNHFDVIKSMSAFFGTSYYCNKCDTPYQNKNRVHHCKKSKVCNMCMGPAHNNRVPETFCKDCNRYCYNAACLAEHTKPEGICDTVYKCPTCNRIKKRNEEHSCTHYRCKNCQKIVEFNSHLCYMKQKVQKGGRCSCIDCSCNGGLRTCSSESHKCSYTEKYLFFDYEATQESGVHEANFVHVKDFNGESWDFADNDSFCEWLISPEHKGYTCIAHNAKGYDSHFILKYCVENTIKPYTIYCGTKLMLLEVSQLHLKIIDSLNFVASPLSAFPKTFGLRELKKGYFPHLFNTANNQNYIGPIPAVEYYSPDTMRSDAREMFMKWHAERVSEKYRFEFRKELEEYCRSDVDILRRGCLELRKQFLDIANIDPFRYLTIASTCMAIYRSKYLEPDTLAVVKTSSEEPLYSAKSIAWLNSIEKEHKIVHALNGGEAWILGAKVDGFCEETKTVYQFHGCFWHGCMRCYEPDRINPKNRHSMGDLYNRTNERSKELRAGGYTVIEMWECCFNPIYRKISDRPPVGFNPRDAFYGGRTNACKLRVSGHKMRYIDVVSLYPTVMYNDSYPVGHPTQIVKPTNYDPSWFGFAKCVVLPPKGLYHPVLPSHINKKLMFVLCRKCVMEKCSSCIHTEKERSISGTWTTIELNKAIEKGYKIEEIHEVWHFTKNSSSLFAGYVKDFLKIKLETSPWQKDHTTVEDYVRSVQQSIGVELDVEEVQDNPGKRAVAKICLNSLWGKFGQRQNKKQTKYITEPNEFYKILLDDRLDKSSVVFVNDNVVQITYNMKGHFVENSGDVNVFVAAFTTAHARLRLYDMMDKLGNSLVYYDTDSIVYIDDGHNTIPTGSMLGEWSDELAAEDYITEWVSTGPKSYAFKTFHGKQTCKIKGFTLNYRNTQSLNMTTMKSLLDCEIEGTRIVYNQISRDKETKQLINKRVTKTFRLDYDKRRILENSKDLVDTLPWGY